MERIEKIYLKRSQKFLPEPNPITYPISTPKPTLQPSSYPSIFYTPSPFWSHTPTPSSIWNSPTPEPTPEIKLPRYVSIKANSDYEGSYGFYFLHLDVKALFEDSDGKAIMPENYSVSFSITDADGDISTYSSLSDDERSERVLVDYVTSDDNGKRIYAKNLVATFYDANYRQLKELRESSLHIHTIQVPEEADPEPTPTPTPRETSYPSSTPRPSSTPYEFPSSRSCRRRCSTGKPCGDSCIAMNKTCTKGPGCACWAN